MFGLSGIEIFLILLFAFLIFGPDKLPKIAKTVGKAVQRFRSAQEEMSKVVKTEIYDPSSDEPVKNPLKSAENANRNKVENKESFAARKAKYDKERDEKKKREAAAEAARETRIQATEEADAARAAAIAAGETPESQSATSAATHEKVMEARKVATAKAQAENVAKKAADQELADELLGMKKAPVKKVAAAKPVAEGSVAEKPAAEKTAVESSAAAEKEN